MEIFQRLQLSFKKDRNIYFLFLILSFFVFFPSFFNLDPFWDDERFIFLNPYFLQAKSPLSFWNPLSDFYKSWPLGYSFFWILIKAFPTIGIVHIKILNIIFHSLNGFLVLKILKKFNLPYSLLYSLIFLLHPFQVENVSWAFQLLTILSFTFFCLCLISILNYTTSLRVKNLTFALLFFIFSIWTKSIGILLPFGLIYIFWLKKVPFKYYFFLIPFFAASFFVGISTQKEFKSENGVTISSKAHSFFNKTTNSSFPALFKDREKVQENDEKLYFDFIFNKKEKPDPFTFEPQKIFSQGSFHYLAKSFLPINLQFIYKSEPVSYYKIIFFILVIVIVPSLLYFKKKDRLILSIPVFTLVLLLPYLGITFITFFYWSPVSDRYAYYFLFSFILILNFLIVSNISLKIRVKIMTVFILALSLQSFLYGLKFNNPTRLYEEIITYKPHPVIYSLIFEHYLINLEIKKAREVFDEAYRQFPNDPYVLQDKFRIETMEKNSNGNNQ